ncbi:MAG: hypothetical protein ACI4M6_03970 [Christensenellaceae bacterium]
MFEFLPDEVLWTLRKVKIDTVSEIRLRVGQPLVLKVLGEYVSLAYVNGFQLKSQDLVSTLLRISEHSVYAHQETVKCGYITTKEGLRVGLCGTVVMGGDGVRYFGEITSMLISIPHEILSIFDKTAKAVFNSGVKSLIIIGLCGGGKTTLIREIARYSASRLKKNVLVCDERGEIGLSSLSCLASCGVDCLKYATKNYACYHAVKSLRPDVICLDEIVSMDDARGINFAKSSGVEIIATCHAPDLPTARLKPEIKYLLHNKIFKYAIIIDKNTFQQRVVSLYD